MAEEEEPTPSPVTSEEVNQLSENNDHGESSSSSESAAAAAATMSSMADDLQRTVMQSRDSAVRSARTLQHNLPHYMETSLSYERAFFNKIKEGLMSARENPAPAVGYALTAAFIFLPGPRRFLFRNTLGRLQSHEARFHKAEKNVKEFVLSVDLMKKESKKLLERAALAEKDMLYGRNELIDVGGRIQSLSKSVNKVEAQAADLMDGLREIPSRDALKLRAEIAAMTSALNKQKAMMDKHIMKISDLGLPV